jgi:hypothetical protein
VIANTTPTPHARDALSLDHDRLGHLLAQRQVLLPFDDQLGEELISFLVALGTRAVHRGPFAAVEQPELDGRGIGQDAHGAPQGVDLANDLPLGDSADRRVTAHLTDGIAVHRQERGSQAHPRGGQGGLEPSMAGADDDHIEPIRITHTVASSSFAVIHYGHWRQSNGGSSIIYGRPWPGEGDPANAVSIRGTRSNRGAEPIASKVAPIKKVVVGHA